MAAKKKPTVKYLFVPNPATSDDNCALADSLDSLFKQISYEILDEDFVGYVCEGTIYKITEKVDVTFEQAPRIIKYTATEKKL